MRSKRRIASLAAVAAFAVGVAACGSDGDEGEDGGEQAAATQKIDGELLVWDWDGAAPGFKQSFAEIDKRFEAEHPGVTIKRVTQPFPNYAELMQATFTGGSGPCVAELLAASSGPAVLHFSNGLVPLNDQVSPEFRENVVGLDVASEDFDPDGTVYALPFGLQPQVMYYNKALFKQAGLDPESPPQTYEELVDAAEALKAKGITPFGGGNKEGFMSEWWFSFLFPSVGTIEDAYALARGDLAFTDPKVKTVVDRYIDLVEAGYFPEGVASTPSLPAGEQSFAKGEQAMYVGLGGGGFSSYVTFNKALGVENVGVIESLGGEGGEPNFLPGGPASTWGVTKYCDNQATARAYVEFITSPEASKTLWEVGGIIPGDKRVAVGADAPPQVSQMVEAFAGAESLYPPHGLWKAEVDKAFISQLQLAVAGKGSVDDALSAAQEAQDRAK